jgi:hypothetical protein
MRGTNDQLDLKALILTLVGSGISHPLLRSRIDDQLPYISCQELDAALVKLQLSGELHQLHHEAGCVWAVGTGEEELFENFSPDVIEQILNPGEFVELDVDQFLAELDDMIARARKE